MNLTTHFACLGVLLALVAACGRPQHNQNDGKQPQDGKAQTFQEQQTSTDGFKVPIAADPNPSTSQEEQAKADFEGDFAGIISIQNDGGCEIVNGNETYQLNCELTRAEDAFQVRLDYSRLFLPEAPVCLFQSIRSSLTLANIEQLTRSNSEVSISVATTQDQNQTVVEENLCTLHNSSFSSYRRMWFRFVPQEASPMPSVTS